MFSCSTTDLGNLSIVDTFFGVYFCVCGGVVVVCLFGLCVKPVARITLLQLPH